MFRLNNKLTTLNGELSISNRVEYFNWGARCSLVMIPVASAKYGQNINSRLHIKSVDAKS